MAPRTRIELLQVFNVPPNALLRLPSAFEISLAFAEVLKIEVNMIT